MAGRELQQKIIPFRGTETLSPNPGNKIICSNIHAIDYIQVGDMEISITMDPHGTTTLNFSDGATQQGTIILRNTHNNLEQADYGWKDPHSGEIVNAYVAYNASGNYISDSVTVANEQACFRISLGDVGDYHNAIRIEQVVPEPIITDDLNQMTPQNSPIVVVMKTRAQLDRDDPARRMALAERIYIPERDPKSVGLVVYTTPKHADGIGRDWAVGSKRVLAVADGVAEEKDSHLASRIASQLMAQAMETELVTLISNQTIITPYEYRMWVVNKMIQIRNRMRDEYHLDDTGATTLSASIEIGDQIYFCNLGDTRQYLYVDGQLDQFTQDNSVVSETFRDVTTGKINETGQKIVNAIDSAENRLDAIDQIVPILAAYFVADPTQVQQLLRLIPAYDQALLEGIDIAAIQQVDSEITLTTLGNAYYTHSNSDIRDIVNKHLNAQFEEYPEKIINHLAAMLWNTRNITSALSTNVTNGFIYYNIDTGIINKPKGNVVALIACSDGVHDSLTHDEFEGVVADAVNKPEATGQDVAEAIKDRVTTKIDHAVINLTNPSRVKPDDVAIGVRILNRPESVAA